MDGSCTTTHYVSGQHLAVDSNVTHVVYVDGVGSGVKDGSSMGNAFQYLSEAYGAFNSSHADGETAVIVVGGAISIADDTGLTNPANRSGEYALPSHSGMVVITSKYGVEDYTGSSSIAFNDKILHLFGNTRLENIVVSSAVSTLFGGYNSIYMGTGIVSNALKGWVR